MGLEAEPGRQTSLHRELKNRGFEVYPTFGGHDIIARPPAFRDVTEYRKIVDSVMFITENDKPIVGNVTSYLIFDHFRKQAAAEPTAFCFIRSGRHSSRDSFDETVQRIYEIESVVSASVVIGIFDLVCEVQAKDLVQLRQTVDWILSTPGVSSRATMVCVVIDKDRGVAI
jgi:hypothetical protein